jgi:SAM-dependent methyltransferase
VNLPLSFAAIVDEIVRFTSLSRDEVEYRVWHQALLPGSNVLEDAARFNITPYVYDQQMESLYREGNGFIFETLVYWAKSSRYCWSHCAAERIRHYTDGKKCTPSEVSILMLGDGTGNDTLYLASAGYTVDYFDVPRSKTYDFAVKRFDHYGFLGKTITPLATYEACLNRKYDVVVSFEVLEHLSEPMRTIADIAQMLKVNGIALITEDFGDIAPHLPTHLRANSRYRGRTPFMFLRHDLFMTWYNHEMLFKPFEFTKLNRVSLRHWLILLRDYNVRSTYLESTLAPVSRFVQKLPYVRIKL